MYLKIMSGENAADSDSRKSYEILDNVASAKFERIDGEPVVHVVFDDGDVEDYTISGNAYVMNESGRTISTFGASEPH